MYFGIFVHCHYRLLSLELRTARTASPGFLKLGEAVRGRPPGPGLGGAQHFGSRSGGALLYRRLFHPLLLRCTKCAPWMWSTGRARGGRSAMCATCLGGSARYPP